MKQQNNSNQLLKCIKTTRNPGRPKQIEFHPNHEVIYTISTDRSQKPSEFITKWNINLDKSELIRGEFENEFYIDICPQEELLLTRSGEQNIIKIWDLKTRQNLHTFHYIPSEKPYADISKNGNNLFIYSKQGNKAKTQVYDLQQKKFISTFEGDVNGRLIKSNYDMSIFIRFDDDKTFKIWNFKTSQNIYIGKYILSSVNLKFLTGDQRFLMLSYYGKDEFIIFDLQEKIHTPIFKTKCAISSVIMTPDSRFAIVGCWDGTLIAWDWKIEREIFRVKLSKSRINRVTGLTICSVQDRFLLATASWDFTLRLWELKYSI